MAGGSKLRHLRFHDEPWEAFCASLPPGKSPTARLEELMAADVAQPPQTVKPTRPTSAGLNRTSARDPYDPEGFPRRPCGS